MLNPTRLKIYINAYSIRLSRGEKLEDIDADYLKLKRLNEKEIQEIHKKLGR